MTAAEAAIKLMPGDLVRLVVPENPRLDGSTAFVIDLTEWGAHVVTAAAATGRFRASREEMEFVARPDTSSVTRPATTASESRSQGYEGEACPQCLAMKMRRNGACLLCDACGSTTGCS